MGGAFSFARSLRADLEKATNQGPPWGDVNPLVVIGLTEAILDLNLGEEQIYAVVRSFVRQLAAQVHPDRNPTNITSDRQRQIIEALDFLDDRQNFSTALNHFRNLKAEDRREMGVLRQKLNNLHRAAGDLEERLGSLNAERVVFEEERAVFEREKREDFVEAPILRKSLEETQKILHATERDVSRSTEHVTAWRSRFWNLSNYIGHMAKKSSAYPGGIFALDVRWAAVASFWAVPNGRNPSPLDENGSVLPGSYEEIFRIVRKKSSVESIIEGWKQAVAALVTKEDLGPKAIQLGLSILGFRNGMASLALGHLHALPSGGRMIGSLPPDRIPINRGLLVHQPPQMRVLETLHPFVVPGGLLVFVQNLARDRAYSMPFGGVGYPLMRFSAKRVVLAVG